MRRRELEHLTVPKLRDRCRRAKLPVYQHEGRRLLKSDLVGQLVKHYRKARPKSKARQTAAQPQQSGVVSGRAVALVETLAEQLIDRTLVDLPGDVTYNRAMHRILRGGTAAKDRMILQRRRLVAIAVLRDGAPDEDGREFWADRYAAEMNIAGC